MKEAINAGDGKAIGTAMLCEYVSPRGPGLTIVNGFLQEATVTEIPSSLSVTLLVVLSYTGAVIEPHDLEVQVSVEAPDGTTAMELSREFRFPERYHAPHPGIPYEIYHVVPLLFPINQTGRHDVQICLDGEIERLVPFVVNHRVE